ncbi:hypothetical protein LNQ03_07270 [Klebsiella pneumoniae subsp. pneumoniae]|nr:hypothetical protein [Klebsiella pneumoniae subsp. pneumoniae]
MRHKERIKAMRADVDTLTLTATPIPRTLNMAMSGMRRSVDHRHAAGATSGGEDLRSREYDAFGGARGDPARKRCAAARSTICLMTYENIQKAADKLAELVPEARIAIGHGQMRERELERGCNDFHHQRFNVLVCTTIIETGIDIPTANTIIIERADHFGLRLAAPAARPRWPLASPGLCLAADAASESDDHRCAKAPRGHCVAGRSRRWLCRWQPTIWRFAGPGNCLGKIRAVRWKPSGFSLYGVAGERSRCVWKAGREPSLEDLHQSADGG